MASTESAVPRTVFLKQSGERLTSGDGGYLWTPEGVRTSAEKIARAFRARDALDVCGLVVVSGSGNIIRGEKLKEHGLGGKYADVLGRIATMQNTIVLAEALEHRKVRTITFITPNMHFGDPTLGDLEPYSDDKLAEAIDDGRLALIAGGMGEDNVTTDSAIVTYAAGYSKAVHDSNVMILKGTKHDGVFNLDPQRHADAQRYSLISAVEMLAHYDLYPAVDKPSLEFLLKGKMTMRVFADGRHDLTTVLDPDASNGSSIGTVITHEDVEKVFAL